MTMTEMDKMVEQVAEEQGLAGGDYLLLRRSWFGYARSKKWPYFSGINVPLIVHVPEKWKHLASSDYKIGGKSDQQGWLYRPCYTLLAMRESLLFTCKAMLLWVSTKQQPRNLATGFVAEWMSDDMNSSVVGRGSS